MLELFRAQDANSSAPEGNLVKNAAAVGRPAGSIEPLQGQSGQGATLPVQTNLQGSLVGTQPTYSSVVGGTAAVSAVGMGHPGANLAQSRDVGGTSNALEGEGASGPQEEEKASWTSTPRRPKAQ